MLHMWACTACVGSLIIPWNGYGSRRKCWYLRINSQLFQKIIKGLVVMRVLPLVLKRIFLYVGNKKDYLMLLKTMNFLAKSGTILEGKKS